MKLFEMKIYKYYIIMLSSLLSLFSCKLKNNYKSVFPATDNAQIFISALEIPIKQQVVSYIISVDKTHIFVNTRDSINHILSFDVNGQFEKDVVLNIDHSNANYELYFTDKNELVMFNGTDINFVDTKSFSTKSYRVYTTTNHPTSKLFIDIANAESLQWQTTEIKKLNQHYHFIDDEIKIENKKITEEYWSKYRAIKNETDNRIYINLQKQYNEYVVSKLPKHQQTIGLVIGNIRYVLLDYNDSMSFYQVEFNTTLNVSWTFVHKNNVIECTNKDTYLNWKNDKAIDGKNTLICLDKNKTSTYKEGLIGNMTTDFIIQLQLVDKVATFKIKDRPLKIANDNRFSLSNNNVVVQYKNSIYIIR